MLIAIVFSACVVQIICMWYVYHKVSSAIERIRHSHAREANNVIAQVEGLLSIYAEINPIRGLPPTRGWVGSPDFLALLIAVSHEKAPDVIVECSSGMSTIVLASCVRNNGHGHVYSLEHDLIFANKTKALLRLHGLDEYATVIHTPLHPLAIFGWSGSWYDLSKADLGGDVDLLVVDGPPSTEGGLTRYPALPVLHSCLSEDVCVIVDDGNRPDESEILKRWVREFPEFTLDDSARLEKGGAVLRRCRRLRGE